MSSGQEDSPKKSKKPPDKVKLVLDAERTFGIAVNWGCLLAILEAEGLFRLVQQESPYDKTLEVYAKGITPDAKQLAVHIQSIRPYAVTISKRRNPTVLTLTRTS